MSRPPQWHPLLRSCLLPFLLFLLLPGCAAKKVESTSKYKGDVEETMTLYTPRDDGKPLTTAELHAFKTVSDLDRNLSQEDAREVELHFKYFVHERRGTMERFISRSARFLPYIKKTFAARGIPEDISYLCMVESGGNPNAISPAGAAGLWQFIPGTGKRYGLSQNAWIDERRDPYKATYAASDYLLKLYSDFGNWHLAVAAYNAGEGKIGRAVSGTGAKDFFDLCRLDGGLEERARLKDETRDYVPRLIAVAKIMRNLKRLGFQEPTPDMAWNLSPMNVPPGTNLTALAANLGLSWEEFSGMNPAFRRAASQPGLESTAYVPPEHLVAAVNFVASREARSTADGREYTVKKGDTLTSIAKRHKVSVTALKEANGFDSLPSIGSLIIVPGKGPTVARGDTPGARYTVRPGDTLSNLARRWGTSMAAIRDANRMSSKETALRTGQRLVVPGGVEPAKAPVLPIRQSQQPTAGKERGAGKAAQSGLHSVKPGETVFGIASRYGVSVGDLCKANKLDPGKPVIRAGQQLVVPGGAAKSPAKDAAHTVKSAPQSAKPEAKPAPNAAKSGSVTVKAGDTLYSIAREHGVSVSALQKANKLGKAGTNLKIGQKLIIP